MKTVKIAAVIISCMFVILSSGGCKYDYTASFQNDGILVYDYMQTSESYALCGQMKMELPQTVYVKPYFKGKEVTQLGVRKYLYISPKPYQVIPYFENVEKVYFPYTLTCCKFGYGYIDEVGRYGDIQILGPEYQFFASNEISDFSDIRQCYVGTKMVYVTENALRRFPVSEENYCYEYDGLIFQIANTIFRFNYEGSPNGDIFFINNFEYGGKIEPAAYEPTREDYIFGGWYKDKACLTAWDFTEDTLPVAEYVENGELIFMQTVLYAKWIDV